MSHAGRIDRLPEERATNVEVLSSPNRVPVTTPRDYTLALIEDIARKHGVTVQEVRGQTRRRHIMLARCEAIRAVAKARPSWSYPELGKFFGGRDHTTIMHHLDKSGRGRQTCRCDWHIEQYQRRNVGASANG